MGTSVAAVPSTARQRARRDRMLEVAGRLLLAGEQSMHMKDVAEASSVSLATLYRYFPSKDHMLMALAENRFSRAVERLDVRRVRGETPRYRVQTYLLREFRAQLREPEVARALVRVLGDGDRSRGEVQTRVRDLHLAAVRMVAEGEGPRLTERHVSVLRIVLGAFSEATRAWLAGAASPAQARFQIVTACRLLDVRQAELERDERRAERN